jgi:hypothetical protein
MYQISKQPTTLHVLFISSVCFFLQTAMISLNSVIHLIFVMAKDCVLFEVRTALLSII